MSRRKEGADAPGRYRLRITPDAQAVRATLRGDSVACAVCLSLLYWSVRGGAHVRVPYGTLVDEPALKPTAHIFVDSKASWHEILDDLPRHEPYP